MLGGADELLRNVVAARAARVDATRGLMCETTSFAGGLVEDRLEAEPPLREHEGLIEALAETEEDHALTKALLRLLEHLIGHLVERLGSPTEHPRMKVVMYVPGREHVVESRLPGQRGEGVLSLLLHTLPPISDSEKCESDRSTGSRRKVR